MWVKKLWSSQLIIKVCVNCSQSTAMSRCPVINCNNKTPNNRGVSYFLQIPVFINITFILHAAKLMICHPKTSYIHKIFKKYLDPSWKLQNEQYCKDHQIGRRLLPRSIPTLLTHKKIKNFADLQRKEHWHKERENISLA